MENRKDGEAMRGMLQEMVGEPNQAELSGNLTDIRKENSNKPAESAMSSGSSVASLQHQSPDKMNELKESLEEINRVSAGCLQLQTMLRDSVYQLNEETGNIKTLVESQDKEVSSLLGWLFGTAIICCILGGILGGLTVHHYMPEITPALEQQLGEAGMMEAIWPKLSKKERGRLMALAKTEDGVLSGGK